MKRVLFAVFLAVPVFAQSTPQPQTVNDHDRRHRLISARNAGGDAGRRSPSSRATISSARGARDVADVLREVPGLVLARSGSPGKATSLFTRGAASTQTLVMWNGIVLNNPYFSGYDWGRFSTAGVEQIEVVRGPFSALYGSEAMAGVVNVLTTPRDERHSRRFRKRQPRTAQRHAQRRDRE